MLLKAKVPSVSGQDGRCSENEALWVYSDKPFWQAHACTEECLCQGWAYDHLLSMLGCPLSVRCLMIPPSPSVPLLTVAVVLSRGSLAVFALAGEVFASTAEFQLPAARKPGALLLIC